MDHTSLISINNLPRLIPEAGMLADRDDELGPGEDNQHGRKVASFLPDKPAILTEI